MDVGNHKDVEVDGARTETGKNKVKVTVRSYRCNTCGEVWSDSGTVPPCKEAKDAAGGDTHGTEEAMAKSNGNGEDKSKRLENALAEGWEVGHTYKKTVKRRKDSKEFICTMQVMKAGFRDQDGKMWDAPTALTTAFMNKKVGVAGRRPAKSFFAKDPKTPKAKHIDTRPGEKKAKPAKAPKAPKAAKPKAAAKPAKAAAAPKAAATQAPPPPPPATELKI